MCVHADMMGDEANDAFCILLCQPDGAVVHALAQPIYPEVTVRIEHDLDDGRILEPPPDMRPQGCLQHARAALGLSDSYRRGLRHAFSHLMAMPDRRWDD
jgi:hypothetical protein